MTNRRLSCRQPFEIGCNSRRPKARLESIPSCPDSWTACNTRFGKRASHESPSLSFQRFYLLVASSPSAWASDGLHIFCSCNAPEWAQPRIVSISCEEDPHQYRVAIPWISYLLSAPNSHMPRGGVCHPSARSLAFCKFLFPIAASLLFASTFVFDDRSAHRTQETNAHKRPSTSAVPYEFIQWNASRIVVW